MRCGGYFEVRKQLCDIVESDSEFPTQTTLAVKRIKESQRNNANCHHKIERELKVLSQIKDSRFNINYWIAEPSAEVEGEDESATN